jgi:hypothetical protein
MGPARLHGISPRGAHRRFRGHLRRPYREGAVRVRVRYGEYVELQLVSPGPLAKARRRSFAGR